LWRRADEVYASLEEESQVTARQLFLRLVVLGEGMEDTRRRVLRSELDVLKASTTEEQMGEMEQVIEAFGRIRLLSFDRDPLSNTPTVEVAHEALLRAWPRLHEWLEGSRADLHQQRQLSNAARDWLGSGRERSYLLVEQRLALFESWAQTTSLALTRDEEEFLQASIAQREAQQQVEQERQLERRSRRVLQALAVVFLLAARMSGGLAYGVYRQSQEVEKQRQTAVTQQAIAEQQKQEAELQKQEVERTTSTLLTVEALQELKRGDPERSVLLGLEALENYPYTPQAESALAQIA
jgi:hypothetical protein